MSEQQENSQPTSNTQKDNTTETKVEHVASTEDIQSADRENSADHVSIDQEESTASANPEVIEILDADSVETEADTTKTDQSVNQANAEQAKQLASAQKKADEYQDQLMRTHAELENLKRRHAQELEKAHKYGLDKFVSELLAVCDSLELGHAAAQDGSSNIEKLREGTELTLKMLTGVMQKFGVEQHNPQGEPFNPELHQAMSMQPNDEVAPNTVVAVVQKGYSLNGRLVRPSMVMVSQATSAE